MTEYSSDDIDESTLLALGRLAFTAINVESRALSVAQQILEPDPNRGPTGHFPATDYINKAIDKLKDQPQDTATRLGIQYLSKSTNALRKRNIILHSVHVISYVTNPPEHSLLFLPTPSKKEHVMTMTPLLAVTLNAQADEFAAIYSNAAQVLRALYELEPHERAWIDGHLSHSGE